MARAQKAMCSSCGGRVEHGESYCDRCGRPTGWATYEERIDWEVRQWRDARGRSSRAETIQPRVAPSRRSNVVVAELDARTVQPLENAVWEAADPDELRASLIARALRLLSRLRALFNARIKTSSSDEPAPSDPVADLVPDPGARPTLVVVGEPEPEPHVAVPVEHVDEAPAKPEVVEPEIPALVAVEPEPVATAPVAPEAAAPEPAVAPVAPAASAAPSEPPPASETPRQPAKPRKRPNRPTNKELLQRALTTLERVDARLHHLEEEIEEIDQAVRQAPAVAPEEDDDLEPPAAAGPFGYI